MVQGLRPSQLCSGAPQVPPTKRLAAAINRSSPSKRVFRTGLLVIAVPIRQILKNVTALLREARQVVDQTLYIRLEPGYRWPLKRAAFTVEEISQLRMVIPKIYAEVKIYVLEENRCRILKRIIFIETIELERFPQAALECNHLDVRILQGCLKNVELREGPLDKTVDVVIAHDDFGRSGAIYISRDI